jgi:hypothetical protein
MIEHFHLDEKSITNKKIPIEYFASKLTKKSDADVFLSDVRKIMWTASLRENELGIKPFENNKIVYNEIQIIQAELLDNTKINKIAKIIIHCLPYNVILIIKYNKKFKIIMHKSLKYKRNENKLVTTGIIITYWIHPKNLSETTKTLLEFLNISNYTVNTLYDLYLEMYNNIAQYKERYLSRNKLIHILYDTLAIYKERDIYEITKYCTPKIYNRSIDSKVKSLPVCYDYEDIWYGLKRNLKTRKLLEIESIKNMKDLIDSYYPNLQGFADYDPNYYPNYDDESEDEMPIEFDDFDSGDYEKYIRKYKDGFPV